MLPTYTPGDEIVATDSRRPQTKAMVVFPHPHQADFWMIKRVGKPPHRIGPEQIWVTSDNQSATTSDSRAFGAVDVSSVMTVVTHLDESTFGEACALLAEEDEQLAESIGRFGIPPFWHRSPGLECLVLLILEQQVSLESGAAVYRRLKNAIGLVDAEQLTTFGEFRMRELGVTRQKAGYISLLAERVLDGSFDIDGLADLTTEMARAALVSNKGIGPWTADAYLLSALRLPDLFPVGDRALQVGAADVLGMSSPPTEEELAILSEPWRPVRAAAARIIWHSYLTIRGREEPPDPIA